MSQHGDASYSEQSKHRDAPPPRPSPSPSQGSAANQSITHHGSSSNPPYPPGPPLPHGGYGYSPHPMNAPPPSSYPPYYPPPPMTGPPPPGYPPNPNPNGPPTGPPGAPPGPRHGAPPGASMPYPPNPSHPSYQGPPHHQGGPPPPYMYGPPPTNYPPHHGMGPPHSMPPSMGEWGGYPPPPAGPPRPSNGSAENSSSNKSNANVIKTEDHENGNGSKPPSPTPNSQPDRSQERQPDHLRYPNPEHDSNRSWGSPPGAPYESRDYGNENDAGRQSVEVSGNERDGSSSGQRQPSDDNQPQEYPSSPSMNPPPSYPHPSMHPYPPHHYYPPHPYGNPPNAYPHADGSNEEGPPPNYHDAYGRPPWGAPPGGPLPPYGHPSSYPPPPPPYDMNGYPPYSMYPPPGPPGHYPYPHHMENGSTDESYKKRPRSNSMDDHYDPVHPKTIRHDYYPNHMEGMRPPPPGRMHRPPPCYPPNNIPASNYARSKAIADDSTKPASKGLSKSQRRKKKMYSDYVGVTYNKTHAKYQACITHYRKQHYLGRYKLAVDAALAYDQSARLLKGPSWKVNFPREQDYEAAKAAELESIGRVGGLDFLSNIDVAGSMAAVASKVEEIASTVKEQGGKVADLSGSGAFSFMHNATGKKKNYNVMRNEDDTSAMAGTAVKTNEECLHKKTPGNLTHPTVTATPAMAKVTPSPIQASSTQQNLSESPLHRNSPETPLPESPNPTRHAMGTEKSTPDSVIRPKVLSYLGRGEKTPMSTDEKLSPAPKENIKPNPKVNIANDDIITKKFPPKSPASAPTKSSSKPNTPKTNSAKISAAGTPKSAPPVIQNNTLAAASALMTLFGNEKSERN